MQEGIQVMKYLVSAALALTLLGTTAAMAQPYGDRQSYNGGYDNRDQSNSNYGHRHSYGHERHRHSWHRGWYGQSRYDDSGRHERGYNGNRNVRHRDDRQDHNGYHDRS
jgi:hypothetical protein